MGKRLRNKDTGEVIELVDGQWVPVSSEPEGSPAERFLGGVWRTTGKPILESLPELASAASESYPGIIPTRDESTGELGVRPTKGADLFMKMLSGTAESHKEQFLKALEEDSGISERAGHLLAGMLPLIGPAAAEAGERAASGDISGGIGEAVGLALPFARPFQNVARGGRALARGSAAKNVARALKTPAGLARRVVSRAEELSNKLGAGSTETLSARALAAEEEALSKLKAVKEASAERIIPIERLQNVRDDILKGADLIEGPELTAKEIVGGGKGSQKWIAKANEEAAARRATLGKRAKPKPGEDVPESFYESEASAAKNLAEKLDRLGAVYEKQTGVRGVPAKEVFKAKSQMGRAASDAGAYSKLAGAPVSSGGRSAKIGQGSLSNELKDAIPGLKEVDMNYSDMRLAGELLENAAAKGAVAGAPAFEILGGRGGLGALLGAATGGVTGNPMAALTGAGLGYGGYAVAREIFNSPLWNSLSARGKYALAKQLGQGGLATTTIVGSAAGRALEEDR